MTQEIKRLAIQYADALLELYAADRALARAPDSEYHIRYRKLDIANNKFIIAETKLNRACKKAQS